MTTDATVWIYTVGIKMDKFQNYNMEQKRQNANGYLEHHLKT